MQKGTGGGRAGIKKIAHGAAISDEKAAPIIVAGVEKIAQTATLATEKVVSTTAEGRRAVSNAAVEIKSVAHATTAAKTKKIAPAMTMGAKKIAFVDSGYGGISTLAAAMGLLQNEDFIYLADQSHSPYGNKSADFIKQRVGQICDYLFFDHQIKAFVIACNTATAIGIDFLRDDWCAKRGLFGKSAPVFVGVEPAIKPALDYLLGRGIGGFVKDSPVRESAASILCLVTNATAKQPRFLKLAKNHTAENTKIIIAPMGDLAYLIEQNIANLSKISDKIAALLSPYAAQNIGAVVLGCTHYCLVKPFVERFFGCPAFDGNAGTAKRLVAVLSQNDLLSSAESGSFVEFLRV